MSRRVSLPAADDLFRKTGGEEPSVRAVPDEPAPVAWDDDAPAASDAPDGSAGNEAPASPSTV